MNKKEIDALVDKVLEPFLTRGIRNQEKIKVGQVFVNRATGQKATVTSVMGNPEMGSIEYDLHDSFRYNSLKRSCTDPEIFLESFERYKPKGAN